jgi:hypothetical protein
MYVVLAQGIWLFFSALHQASCPAQSLPHARWHATRKLLVLHAPLEGHNRL